MNNTNHYIYSKLPIDLDKFNAWKNPNSFHYQIDTDSEFLNKIIVEEIELIRYSQNADLDFEKGFKTLAKEVILVERFNTITLIFDYMLKPITKLRSYKGILTRDLKENSDYIQQEVIIDGKSIIGVLLVPNSSNLDIILDNYFGDSSICCVIQSQQENFFEKNLLHDLIRNCMVHTQTSTINYFALCKFFKQSAQIVRIGGDGYDIMSIQTIKVT